MKGIALNKQLDFLSKFPLKELPHLLVTGGRFYRRLKATYQDYEN
jgi:hypothetical protein